jgi:rhodanese-related sulfurtransferase
LGRALIDRPRQARSTRLTERSDTEEQSVSQTPPTEVPQVDPIEGDRLIAGGALLLDVREPDEWEAGHANDARHLPLARVPDEHADLPPETPIVVICRAGGRSQKAAEYLRSQGYDATNLAGGMRAWSAAGLPVVTDQGTPGTVI